MPHRRKSDSQREKLYRAERLALNSHPCFKDIEECQEYVNSITRTQFWRTLCDKFGRTKLREVKVDYKIHGKATGSWSTIYLPKWAWSQSVILHELSHCVTTLCEPWHGREFAACFLLLVQRFLGQEEYKRLQSEFRNCRVKWYGTHKKRRVLTDEQKAALKDRLALARLVRVQKLEAQKAVA